VQPLPRSRATQSPRLAVSLDGADARLRREGTRCSAPASCTFASLLAGPSTPYRSAMSKDDVLLMTYRENGAQLMRVE